MKTDHRISKLRGRMAARGVSASLILDPDDQFYLSGFKAVIYSRPILFLVHEDRTSIVVPGLEETHARREEAADEVLVYYEHPEKARAGTTHTGHLDRLLSAYPRGSRIGVEAARCPLVLVEHLGGLGFEVVDVGRDLVEMRYVKDAEEIRLMAEAGRLVNLAVEESFSALGEGATEIEVDARGNAALFEETARRHPGATLDAMAMSPSGAQRSVMPHVFSSTRRLGKGDVVIHSRQVALNGYRAELERTVFVGEVSGAQERAFEAARESQKAALDFIKPGVSAAEVDEVSRGPIREAGFEAYAIHRVGHGLGISAHEEPYLRFDNDLILAEGMVYSVEPGIYVPALGGFRHSDTVVLTADGSQPITEYPSDLKSLVATG